MLSTCISTTKSFLVFEIFEYFILMCHCLYNDSIFHLYRDRQRPEHLVSRLKSINEDPNGPRVIAIRQPKGPDGSKGFIQPRVSKLITG